jgi:hypothetical protein
MTEAVPVVHCVAEGTHPAQAACSPVVYLEHMSYLVLWENIILTIGRHSPERP